MQAQLVAFRIKQVQDRRAILVSDLTILYYSATVQLLLGQALHLVLVLLLLIVLVLVLLLVLVSVL